MDVGNKRVDGRVHIRLCTRGEKERRRAGDNKTWEERKMKRGGGERRKRKGETFSVASSISSGSLSASLLRVQTIFIGTRP